MWRALGRGVIVCRPRSGPRQRRSMHCGRGEPTTATIRFRCSRRSASSDRFTPSRWPTATTPGSSSATRRHAPRSNEARFSKDMHAALASGGDVVAEGLPGPAFARHMLTVDPPDHTRLRRLVSAAFSPRRGRVARARACRPSSTTCSTTIAAAGPDARVDLVAAFAFPLPFTVICELLGVPEPDRARLGRGLTALLVPTSTPEEYAKAKAASDAVVAHARRARRGQAATIPATTWSARLISARDGDERLDHAGAAVDDLPADRRRPRHHDQPDRQQRRRPAATIPSSSTRCGATRSKIAAAIEELLRYDAPVPHSTFRYAIEPVELGGVTIPAGAQVIISPRRRQPRRRAVHRPGRTRHRSDRRSPPRVRPRHPLLPRRPAGPHGRRSSPSASLLAPLPASSASPSPPRSCTGATATASCCGA